MPNAIRKMQNANAAAQSMPHPWKTNNRGKLKLRPRGRSGIGRAFYCFLIGRRPVRLHAFDKKS